MSVLCSLICQVQNIDWRVWPTPVAALLCCARPTLKGFDPFTFTYIKLLYNCKRSAWFFLHFVKIKNSCHTAKWASSMTPFSECCTLYQVNTTALIVSIDNRWKTYIFGIQKEWCHLSVLKNTVLNTTWHQILAHLTDGAVMNVVL